MTKQTRTLIAFVIGLVVVVGIVCLLAWATSGFNNWDVSTWFDSCVTYIARSSAVTLQVHG